MSNVSVEVWSRDAVPVFLEVLENAAATQGLDERKGDGGGSFTIAKSDPKLARVAPQATTVLVDTFSRVGVLPGSLPDLGSRIWTGSASGWTTDGSAAYPGPSPVLAYYPIDSPDMTETFDFKVVTSATGANNSLRFGLTKDNAVANQIWVSLYVNTAGGVSVTLARTLAGVSTNFVSWNNLQVGLANNSVTPQDLRISIAISGLNVTFTSTSATTTISATFAMPQALRDALAIGTAGMPLLYMYSQPCPNIRVDRVEVSALVSRAVDPLARVGLLAKRNLIRLKVDGEYLGGFVITKTGDAEVDEGFDKLTYQVSGPGFRSWFDDAVLFPETNAPANVAATTRMFSWASTSAGGWYDASQWVPTFGQTLQGYNVAYKSSNGTGNPWLPTRMTDWPAVVDAEWIWSNDTRVVANQTAGTVYFRHTLALAAGKYRLYIAADNLFDCYVDGILAVDGDQWQKTATADVDLATGTHVFAYKVSNTGGPAGLLVALALLGTDGEPINIVARSQGDVAGWKCCPYPVNEPGWSVGQVLTKIMGEAQARGIRSFQTMQPTWTQTADSNGDVWAKNLAWPLELTNNYAGFLQRFEELSADVWVDPDTFAVNCAQVRGIDRTGATLGTAVALIQPLLNLTAQSDEREAAFKTVVLVKGQTAWVQRSSTPDLADYGRLETSVAVSEAGGTLVNEIGDRTLQRAMIETRSRPIGFVPSPGCVPFVDFAVGDLILVGRGGDGGAPETHRVASISFTQRDDGDLDWAVELDEREGTQQEALDRFLESITGGASGGASMGVTPTIPTRTVRGNYSTTPVPNPAADLRVPAAPATVTTSAGGTYMTDAGTSAALVTVTAAEVTTSVDTSLMTMSSYLFQIKRGTSPWSDLRTVAAVPGTSPSTLVDALTPGGTYQFRAAAIAANGATSAWTTGTAIAAAVDTTAPQAPAGLVVQQVGLLVMVQWNGSWATGLQPADFHHLTVHVGPTAGFTMDGSTNQGILLRANDPLVVKGVVRGATYYLKAVAVDAAGNASAPSAEQTFIVNGIGPADVKLGALTMELLDSGVQSALLTANRLVVGGDNLVVDPRFADVALNTARVAGTTVVAAVPSSSNPLGSLTFPATAQAVPLLTEGQTYPMTLFPGEEYAVAVDWEWVSGTPGLTVQLQVLLAGGTVSTFSVGTASPTSGTPTGTIKGSVVAPASATFGRVRISQDAAGSSRVTNPRTLRKLGNTEIRDGQITTNLLTVNAIDGMTITGATVRTAAAGARIELNNSGIYQYDLLGAVVSQWTPTGFDLVGGTITGAAIIGATVSTSATYPRAVLAPSTSYGSTYVGLELIPIGGQYANGAVMTGLTSGGSGTFYALTARGPRASALSPGSYLTLDETGAVLSVGPPSGLNAYISIATQNPTLGTNANMITLQTDTNSGFPVMLAMNRNGDRRMQFDAQEVFANAPTFSVGEQISAGAYSRRFSAGPAGNYSFGPLFFRDLADTYTGVDYGIGRVSTTRLDLFIPATGIFVVGTGGALNSTPSLVIRGNGAGNPQYEFQNLDAATGTANLFVSGGVNTLQKTSSRRADKLEIESVPVSYDLLRIEPRTWIDRANREADPTYGQRFAGGIVEEIEELARLLGSAVVETLISRDPVTGVPVSLNYDRLAWLLIPVVDDMNERIVRLEHLISAAA